MTNRIWTVLLTDAFGVSGGIPAFNRELLGAMEILARERGWTLRILVLNDTVNQQLPSKTYSSRGFSGKYWRFIWESLRAARGADDVLFGHVHLTPLAFFMRSKRRWLVAHGIEVWNPLSCLRRLGLGSIDKILCVSRYTRDRLVEQHQINVDRTLLFPNTAHFSSEKKSASIELNKTGVSRVIFTLSRLWPEERYKKIDRVIEAMPSVLKAVPNALYMIAGQGADRSRLERIAVELGVANRVIFTGTLRDEEVQSYYEACEIFILPSLGEGFGIVFLEAMACAKPCIGADAGAVPEVIQDGRTGLVVRPDDSQAISRALIRLLQDEPLRRSMGQAGRDRFNAEFSVDRFRERLAELTKVPS